MMNQRLVFVVMLVSCCVSVHARLKGKFVSCEGEGQIVRTPPGADPCITCVCRNKAVRCRKPECPQSDGCHVLLTHKPKAACCHTCRGCLYQGRELLSGELLVSKDKCEVMTCKASVVTVSPTRCHVPCDNPVHLPGHCCPVCPADDKTDKGGCFHGSALVANGEQVPWKGDLCTKCRCIDGRFSCAKRACPVLNCPHSKIVKDDKDCCPRCEASNKENYPTNGNCIFRGKLVKNGAHVSPDECSKCECKDGSTVCKRDVCPVVDCPLHAVVHKKGDCCPSCLEPAGCPVDTVTDGKDRLHDEEWKRDSCTACRCYGGSVSCQTTSCEDRPCPANTIKVHLAGQCCSTCVESDSRCTVRGSGSDNLQYTTFDGKRYDFTGVCKYTLTEDHVYNTFSVRILQGYKTPKTYQVKKIQVIVKTPNNGSVTVTMDTRLVAKVNKTVVKSGFTMPQVYLVETKNLTVSLTLLALKVKVSLRWDGYTEVVASRDWQEKLSGLCGNYNRLARDDLRSKKGRIFKNIEKFGDRWKVGGQCFCDQPVPANERRAPCSANPIKRLVARQQCDVMLGPVFEQCRKVLSYKTFYLTCLDNVCRCGKAGKHCQCPTVLAMEKECHKMGLRVKLPENFCLNTLDEENPQS